MNWIFQINNPCKICNHERILAWYEETEDVDIEFVESIIKHLENSPHCNKCDNA